MHKSPRITRNVPEGLMPNVLGGQCVWADRKKLSFKACHSTLKGWMVANVTVQNVGKIE